MKRKGVCFDVGRVMAGNWRPVFDPKVVHRELEIIKNDLHCNAVRICALDIGRLMAAADAALKLGLEVWLSPEMWDKSAEETHAYIAKAAARAEKLRAQWPDRLVHIVGSELTLFMQGILPGSNVTERMCNPSTREIVKAGKHNQALNAFLAKANKSVRDVFHGQVTYASLAFEKVDWSLFDFVGVDHYRAARIRDQYASMLRPFFAYGKPVINTEFGCRTYRGADTSTEGMAGDITDNTPNLLFTLNYMTNAVRSSLFGTQLSPPQRPLKKGHVRDEGVQARELTDMLSILDREGVEGTFVFTFVSPTNPYNDNPLFDFDMNSFSLVKSYEGGKHGTTYPDMTWEPKESFKAVASYYAQH